MKTSIFASWLSVAVIALFSLSSCKSCHDHPKPPEYGSMRVQVAHMWDDMHWELNKDFKHPTTGDTLNFSMFKYYISNIKLKNADGNWWTQEESYYLVDASVTDGNSFIIKDIPVGEYVEIQYTLGVDSVKNVSGVFDGALSVGNNMYWDWNSGFVMLKVEGSTPNSSTKKFAVHLGGFQGQYNIVTTKNTGFGNMKLFIDKTTQPQLWFKADLSTIWNTVGSMKNPDNSSVHMITGTSKKMGDDFYKSFIFDSIR